MTGKNILQYKIEKDCIFVAFIVHGEVETQKTWMHFTCFPPPVLMSQTQLREQSRSDLKIEDFRIVEPWNCKIKMTQYNV